MAEEVPEDYKELSFVCLRPDGAYESASTVSIMCRTAQEKVPGLEDFHFHTLRHTFTSNLLSNGAQPKDVQELLGHADVSTTMNIYAHATKEAKRSSARRWIRWSASKKEKLSLVLLDKGKNKGKQSKTEH